MNNQLSEQLRKEIEEKAITFLRTVVPSVDKRLLPEHTTLDRQSDLCDGYTAGATHYALRVQELEEQRDKLLEFAREWVADVEDAANHHATQYKGTPEERKVNYEKDYKQYMDSVLAGRKYTAIKQLIESIKP